MWKENESCGKLRIEDNASLLEWYNTWLTSK